MSGNEKGSVILGPKEIAKILPHRYPFLLVDRVTYLNLEENKIIAQKNVTINEEFFKGHFPEYPIMPGVLILEALAQTGGILIHQKGYQDKIALFLNISNAKFRNPVFPGDVLELHAECIHVTNKGGRSINIAYVNGKIAAESECSFALVDKNKL